MWNSDWFLNSNANRKSCSNEKNFDDILAGSSILLNKPFFETQNIQKKQAEQVKHYNFNQFKSV